MPADPSGNTRPARVTAAQRDMLRHLLAPKTSQFLDARAFDHHPTLRSLKRRGLVQTRGWETYEIVVTDCGRVAAGLSA